jgi:hypothetical protein
MIGPLKVLPKTNLIPMNTVRERFRMGALSSSASSLTSLICWTLGLQVLEKNGGDDGTRTRGPAVTASQVAVTY